MTELWSQMVKRTVPYIPGEQLEQEGLIKLNTNENPYPPSPTVFQAIQEEMKRNLERYPSPSADELRGAIAERFGLSAKNVFVGNGSDEVLAFSFMAFFEPGNPVLFPDITYSFYPVYAKLFNIPYEQIRLNDDFTLPVERFFQSEGGVILPNPNAPTGLYEELDQIKRIVQENKGRVVIIDEAYIDFAPTSAVGLVHTYNNLLIVQTMSKSRSLAGLRVGYAIGDETLIEGLTRIKDSFNSYPVDRLALAGAKASFEDNEHFSNTTAAILSTRERVIKQLRTLNFSVLPSATNFILVKHDHLNGCSLYEELKARGILVRHFNTTRISNYIRVTIGTEEQMDIFLNELTAILASASPVHP
ncbi:histidinol-phosphate transaminase [Sporosarcina sp. Te-1]|uniref:histidinol-phosphate transaminase n=1 Tax=Sporosarcina sp. Te-1 TaxID=2818390 RepID=UPI001A9EF3C3|nr:histidinol-phosphate transaminase [Sporosarcina sp. Te-1]QTD41310.1 histidinol-phosphate transaminase [Sporosarcina sp. Te-1]